MVSLMGFFRKIGSFGWGTWGVSHTFDLPTSQGFTQKLGGGFKHLFIFTLGEMIPFDEHICSNGLVQTTN